MNIIHLIVGWLHLLAAVVWIGAMIMLLLVIIPSAKEVLGTDSTFKRFIKSVGKKMTFLVNVSIAVLIITGIILSISADENSNGLSVILAIKLAFVFAMVGIHLCRNKVIAPRLEQMAVREPASESFIKLQKLQMNLVWANLNLGILVLFLSMAL
jgi:uncharacterized membrane protein